MVDSRFFHNAGELTLKEVAALTGAALASAGGTTPDSGRRFSNVAPLDRAEAGDISFLDNVKYIDAFMASKAGACFVRPKYVGRAPGQMVLLVTDEPYYCYALTAQAFYPKSAITPGVSTHAHIAKTAAIGKGARIDAGAVIGEKATIGDRCWIGAHTVVGDGVEIGDESCIGSHCSLSHTLIGRRVIIHRGVHIGQDGFGFATGGKGMVKMPQLGRVLIGDNVEIGSGTCIDRGTGPDTVVGNGCKIDNLVQIGHNVQLGKHVVIAAQCGIAGSTQVGDGVMMGGQAGISGHVRIGAGAKIAAQAGVMTDVPAGESYGGSPAVPARDWHRQTIAMARIVKKKEDIDE